MAQPATAGVPETVTRASEATARAGVPDAGLGPLGVHALVWTGGWDEPSARAALANARGCGFDLLEVPLLDPATVDPELTAALAAEYGLAITCSLGLGPETDISSADPAAVRAGEELLLAAVAVARRAGSSYLGGVIYSAMAKYAHPATRRGRDHAVGVLRQVAAAAAEAGVVIGLEPVNRYESNLVNTVAQALALADEVGADNVVVHPDTYHMHIEEQDPAAAVRLAAAHGRLGYLHVGESHRGYLGSGSVDFPAVFRALHEVGYGGPVVFESFSSAVVAPAFTAALAIWREPWQDPVDLATHARGYLKAQLYAAANPSRKERP